MDILSSIAPLICIFVAMFFIWLGIGWFGYKSGAKKYLKPLSALINGTVKIPIFGESSLEGVWGGRKVKIVYAPANSRFRAEKIIFYFSCALPVEMAISRKRFFDKIKDRLKASLKMEDMEFDSKYVVRTKDEMRTRNFLNHSRRDIIQRLFNLITLGTEEIPPLESKKDRQALKIFEGNKTILELKLDQIVLRHYIVKISLPPSDAVPIIFEGILKTMKQLTE